MNLDITDWIMILFSVYVLFTNVPGVIKPKENFERLRQRRDPNFIADTKAYRIYQWKCIAFCLLAGALICIALI